MMARLTVVLALAIATAIAVAARAAKTAAFISSWRSRMSRR